MKHFLRPLKRLILQALLLLVLYFFSRICFTLINLNHFDGLTVRGFFRLSFFAIRYDLSAICALNILYSFLLFLPSPTWRWPRWERFTQGVFIFCNGLAFLFELADWAYFPYNFKRATGDVLKLVATKGDFWSVLPDYLISYWYIPIAMAVFIFLLIKANNYIRKAASLISTSKGGYSWIDALVQLALLAIVFGALAIGVRGGLQYIPMGVRNAVQVTKSEFIPIVINTPFSIITTLKSPSLQETQYMSDQEAKKLMPFLHHYQNGMLRKKNIVVLIIESGSKEFTALGGRESYTPFLDSLMGKSLVCTQGFANGQTSAEGIPAIIAGIPSLMDEAFMTSDYGTDRITALPEILKPEGYESAFYHGGTNGTMSFDVFSAAAGYDHYFGRTEYHNEADYDGAWGIWDEPFLQYAVKNMSGMKQPFFASVFTVTSHPPYHLPKGYKERLPKGPLPIQQCIAYTDQAIRKFFRTAAAQPWYDNTLFVITADHCSPQNSGGFYGQGLGQYAIPILFFAPGDTTLKGFVDTPVQQLDIMPSVLDYIGYHHPFFGFGNSLFNERDHRVITYNNEAYQWLQDGYLLEATAMKPTAYYVYPADSNSRHNLLQQGFPPQIPLLRNLKAFVQRYEHVLIHNQMR